MRIVVGSSKNMIAGSLLSSVLAGASCIATGSVSPDNAPLVVTPVVRVMKGDQLPLAHNAEHPGSKKTTHPSHVPLGCEPAFSPFAYPGQVDLLNYCMT
jgi:hypothetical protein